ncbi:hypothetical protein Tco_1015822 [Tanacetum coccineum]|uniref:Uncharacterized protein n=1 Tax=Tanacetum coccineum TaxID=301880 RepID=A0ABQ5FPC1_9ASTR
MYRTKGHGLPVSNRETGVGTTPFCPSNVGEGEGGLSETGCRAGVGSLTGKPRESLAIAEAAKNAYKIALATPDHCSTQWQAWGCQSSMKYSAAEQSTTEKLMHTAGTHTLSAEMNPPAEVCQQNHSTTSRNQPVSRKNVQLAAVLTPAITNNIQKISPDRPCKNLEYTVYNNKPPLRLIPPSMP